MSWPLSGLAVRVVLGAGLALAGRSVKSSGVGPGHQGPGPRGSRDGSCGLIVVVSRSGPTFGGCEPVRRVAGAGSLSDVDNSGAGPVTSWVVSVALCVGVCTR